MSSTLRVTNVSDTTGGTSTNLMSGLAKSWADFDGTGTPAYNDSFNHSSLTDLGTGYYRLLFSASKSSSNYAAHGTSTVGTSNRPDQTRTISKAVGSYEYWHAEDEPAAAADVSVNNGTSFGDLA